MTPMDPWSFLMCFCASLIVGVGVWLCALYPHDLLPAVAGVFLIGWGLVGRDLARER